MMTVVADSYDAFLNAFVLAVQLGGQPTAVGGNAFTLPDGSDPTVVGAVGRAGGVTVTIPDNDDGGGAKKTGGGQARKREKE